MSLLLGDCLGQRRLLHAGGALHSQLSVSLVQLVAGMSLNVLTPILHVPGWVGRSLVALRLPVVAHLLEGVLERRERHPVGPLTLAVGLNRAVVRLHPCALRLLGTALQRRREFLFAW